MSENRVKLMGVQIKIRLNFVCHIEQLSEKASKKLHALSRITKLTDITKRRFLMNSFMRSQFSYCLFVWMFHSTSIENRIDRLHDRALTLAYNDFKKHSFQ